MGLHPDILKRIEQSKKDGGIDLRELKVGAEFFVQTQNTIYHVIKTGDTTYTIQGNERICPEPKACRISGSTWGGSMLKMNFVGINMHMEFYVDKKMYTTSKITEAGILR